MPDGSAPGTDGARFPAEAVALVFRALLGRDPGPADDLAPYGQVQSVDGLVDALSRHPAFLEGPVARHTLSVALGERLRWRPARVDIDVEEELLAKLFSITERVWSALGSREAHWSVLTDESYRAGHIDQALADFYGSGRGDAEALMATLERAGVHPSAIQSVTEIGCGVGRVTMELARRFPRVLGLDVSEGHLAMAEEAARRYGRDNASFKLVRSIADYAALAPYDLLFSIIVLQHNPPPVQLAILDAAFARLRPGGCCYFQIPTFIEGYAFDAAAYVRHEEREMEMHCVPQPRIFALMRKHRIEPLEVVADGACGDRRFGSYTFVGRKEKAGLARLVAPVVRRFR